MNQEKRPEALRLADWCDANSSGAYRPSSEAAAELRRQYFALNEWFEKTQCVQKAVHPRELGMHRADILRTRIESLQAELVVEAVRTAEEKLRADQMTEQHRLQCNISKSAVATLVGLGYTDQGGEQWTPPIGKAPDFSLQAAAYARGWYACTGWAKRPDLASDIGSPAYVQERERLLNQSTDQSSRECLQQSAEQSDPVESGGVSVLDLTQDRLKEYLTYDPDTGIFTSLISGKQIGWKGWKGYVSLAVWDVTYRAHRLAWLYMTGEWPTNLVDHRDGDKSNNRFNNLRESTHSQNSANGKAKASASGLPRGVRKASNSKSFKAEITVHNRKIHLGCFPTAEEASEVYTLASELIHGDYAYHLSRNKASTAQGANHVR